MKNIRIFYLKISIFLVVKFSVYLNRRVFVMSVNSLNSDRNTIKCSLKVSAERQKLTYKGRLKLRNCQLLEYFKLKISLCLQKF